MKIEFNFESPYTPTGEPRQDLPTGEVLAGNGTEWIIGYFNLHLVSGELRVSSDYEELYNVVRFAPLPTIIEDDTTTL